MDSEFTYYANAVINNEIAAGDYIKAACRRFFSMLENDRYEFREDKARKVLKFCDSVTHGKNKQLNITIQEWQKFILFNLFGFYYRGSELRVFHNLYCEVARKNGKSTLISLIALYMMIADGEYRSEVDVVANSHKQAKILYNMASDYCESIDPSGKYFTRYRDNIQFKKTKSVLQVLASDTKSLDGYNAYCFIQDEVHEAPNDLLYNVLKTSQASRENPLAILITTAGLNMDCFCYHYRSNCIDILNGLKDDESQLVMIYSLDEGDDYTDKTKWLKANPNLNVSVRESYLDEQVRQSQNNTALTSNIMTKNFNVWSQTYDVWMEDQTIINSMDEVGEDFFIGKKVYVGVDLAAVSDLTAVALMTVEDGIYYYHLKYYLPSSCLSRHYNQEKYKEWYRNKQLTVIQGNVTDYDYIINDFIRLRDKGLNFNNIFYDAWNSTQWAVTMTEQGFQLTPYSQSLGNFNRPTKEIERIIRSGAVRIDKNPITRWCFLNTKLKMDYNANAKPVKAATDNDKIDGVIAMIEALGGYLLEPQYTAII